MQTELMPQTCDKADEQILSTNAKTNLVAKTFFRRVMNVAELLAKYEAVLMPDLVKKSPENTEVENWCTVFRTEKER